MLTIEAIGRLTADAEVKAFQDGTRSITIRVAVEDPTMKNADGTTRVVYILANSTLPQHLLMQKYLVKGKPVFLRGHDRSKVYADKNGQAQIGYNMKITELNFLPSDPSLNRQPQQPGAQQPVTFQPQQQPLMGQPQAAPQPVYANQVAAQPNPNVQVYGQHVQQQAYQQPVMPPQQGYVANDPNDTLPF